MSLSTQYDTKAGVFAAKPPEAPKEPEKKTGLVEKVKNFFTGSTPAPAPAPTPAPAAPKGPAPSLSDRYDKKIDVFASSKAKEAAPLTPEQTKKAGMAAFLDDAPKAARTEGANLRSVLSMVPAGPQSKPIFSLGQQSLLDDPKNASMYVKAIKQEQPKTLVQRLKDFHAKAGEFAEHVALGEIATVQSFISAIEWLAPDKEDGTPGNIKRGAGDVADRMDKWIQKAREEQQKQYGDPTFVDELAEGVGSSALFFIPGLGVARGATMLATVSPRVAMIFGGSASAALESMAEAGSVYRSVVADKNAYLARNSDVRISPEMIDQDASEAATKTFWANAILIGLTNRFGVFNPDAAGFVRRVIMSSPIEGVQEAAQQIISNFTEEKEDLLEGSGKSGLIGMIVGGLMGGGVETLTGSQTNTKNAHDALSMELDAVEPFDIDRAIESGEIAREAIYTPDGSLQPGYATSLINDIALKMEKHSPEIAAAFREKAVTENMTPASIMAAAQSVVQEAARPIDVQVRDLETEPQNIKLYRGQTEDGGLHFTTDPAYAKGFGNELLEGTLPEGAKVYRLQQSDFDAAFAKGITEENQVWNEIFKQGYDAIVGTDSMASGELDVIVNPAVLSRFSVPKSNASLVGSQNIIPVPEARETGQDAPGGGQAPETTEESPISQNEQEEPVMWTREQGEAAHTAITPDIQAAGFNSEIVGSVATAGSSAKDIDILITPQEGTTPTVESITKLVDSLRNRGFKLAQFDDDIITFVTPEAKTLELFLGDFPEVRVGQEDELIPFFETDEFSAALNERIDDLSAPAELPSGDEISEAVKRNDGAIVEALPEGSRQGVAFDGPGQVWSVEGEPDLFHVDEAGVIRKLSIQKAEAKKEEEPKPKKRSGGALAFNIKDFLPKKGGGLTEQSIDAIAEKAASRSEIAKYLEEGLGVTVRSGHFKDKALGIFKPWAHVVRLKSKLGDIRIPVLVHESAHYLDYTLFGQPVKGKAKNDPKNWRTTKFVSNMIPMAELDPLLVEYGGTPTSKKREAFAEFVRYWVTEPQKAQERAPKFLEIWEKEIMPQFPEVRDILIKTRNDWERWNDMPAVAKVLSQISFKAPTKEGIVDRATKAWHDVLSDWTDDLHPIKRFTDLARERGVKFDLENDPYIMARLSRGWVGKASVFLEKGTFRTRFWKMQDGKATPEFTGKGFKEIMQPVVDAHATEDLSAYLVARRAVNLNERGIHSGINDATAKKALEDLTAKHPDFKNIATELDKYQDSLLSYLFESGLMSQKTYDSMRQLSRDYVPFYRVVEEAERKGLAGKTLADIRSPIKRIKGSDRDIVNPLESIVKNTYAMISAAERNRVAISMVNLSTKHPELAQLFEDVPAEQTKVASVKINDLIEQVAGGELGMAMNPNAQEAQAVLGKMGEEIVNIFRPSFFQDNNIITVMIEGKPKSFYVEGDIYRAMHGMDVEDVGFVWKMLSYPARWLRAGATLTPEFMVRNPARDMMSAFVYSDHGFMPPIDVGRGLYGALTKSDAYWLWRMGGGEQAMLVSMDRTTLQKNYRELIGESTLLEKAKRLNPVETLRVFSEFSEKMTRVGEARKALERGANPLEAAFAAREITLDFGKIGAKARSVNMIVAFFNASIQGSVRMVRAFQEKPLQTTTKTLFGITLPSVLLTLWNMQEPDWDEIPQWQKNIFWMIKIGDTWYRFPKPFELGIIFGSIPERIIESIARKDAHVWPELRKAIIDGASPSLLPTAILPILENTTNYSFFLDRNIVPDSLEPLPEFAQYTAYTSETAKHIGKWLDYSPAKIDNLIHGYFAGLGDYALRGMDRIEALIRGKDAPPPPPKDTLADLPVIKAFVVREPIGGSSESVNRFYERAESASAAKEYWKDLVKAGKAEEAEAWYADHVGEIALDQFYEKTRETIAAMRRLQNEARDSKTLTPEEKRARIDQLGRLMTDVAHKAITMKLKNP